MGGRGWYWFGIVVLVGCSSHDAPGERDAPDGSLDDGGAPADAGAADGGERDTGARVDAEPIVDAESDVADSGAIGDGCVPIEGDAACEDYQPFRCTDGVVEAVIDPCNSRCAYGWEVVHTCGTSCRTDLPDEFTLDDVSLPEDMCVPAG